MHMQPHTHTRPHMGTRRTGAHTHTHTHTHNHGNAIDKWELTAREHAHTHTSRDHAIVPYRLYVYKSNFDDKVGAHVICLLCYLHRLRRSTMHSTLAEHLYVHALYDVHG